MAATPSDIAKFTQDGVVIIAQNETLHAEHPESTDERDQEIEMFYVSASDGQAMLNEKFDILSQINPVHKGIEVDERLDLGGSIALTPIVPSFRLVDDLEALDKVARLRAFAREMGEDRMSIEMVE